MIAGVTDNRTVSETFTVTNDVKQDCLMAPTLFTLMLSVMSIDAYRDECPGILIVYTTDGHLSNCWCMQTPTRVSMTTVRDLLLSDECALNTALEEDIQRSMDLFTAGCANFGQNGGHAPTGAQPEIKFPGITANGSAKIVEEVEHQIPKANRTFNWL
ncbi:unnamed protein product [Schistocephalus solidus]|uniref:Reverse transcriptase domain-containing protein n=1 Tax=Schistocephalus solidus TaxID=70667 RepID=A0A183TRJ4_SCHSO|nr:unnamed protein product [Schistocephalus solidus]